MAVSRQQRPKIKDINKQKKADFKIPLWAVKLGLLVYPAAPAAMNKSFLLSDGDFFFFLPSSLTRRSDAPTAERADREDKITEGLHTQPTRAREAEGDRKQSCCGIGIRGADLRFPAGVFTQKTPESCSCR